MVRATATAAIIFLMAIGITSAQDFTGKLGDAPDAARITENFNQAIRLLEDGQYEDARLKFEEVLAGKPDSALALQLRNAAKQQVILNAFIEAPQPTLDTIKQFLRIAESGRREWLRDADRITALVKDVVSGEFDKKWLAIHEIQLAGQHAVPYLIEALKTPDREVHSRVTMALISTGDSGVLPMTEALAVEDDVIKQELIFALEQIGDFRALPALAKIANFYTTPSVKQSAEQAIRKISNGRPILNARDYYLQQADAYYQRKFEVVQGSHEDFIMWSWDAESQKLAARIIPDYAFYLEMAEKNAYSALEIDNRLPEIYTLLISVYFQQLHTYEALLEAAERGLGGLTEDELAGIKARRERVTEILRTSRSLGRRHHYNVLARALKESNNDVAVSSLQVLREIAVTSDLPVVVTGRRRRDEQPLVAAAQPLIAALDSDVKIVRYNAAATLAGIADRAFPGIEKVAPTLNQALGERGARVALVADSNIQTINQLRSDLHGIGYIVDTATSDMQALNVGYAVPMKDVMIIDADLTEALNTFLADFRSRRLPIIVLVTEFNEAETRIRYEGKVSGFVRKPIDAVDLDTALRTALSGANRTSGKNLALEMNYLAAKTLASLDVTRTALPVMDSVDALARALELPDEVRLEAMKALSNFAAAGAQHQLATVAGQTGNSLQARLAALDALKSISIKHGGVIDAVYELAERLLLDREPAVRTAAARVLGAGRASNSATLRLAENAKWIGDAKLIVQ